ncbi:GGDEF domain-containing protein [Asanoa iriomotensis]|uniref:GGDEF domain-containing protein n=1 Tax=Asanoa iriomotensis TaxID=234613 RepID=A0ABQ4BYL7_9ACTN|nr:GGDEF domain-containing protein [Asanoa iriomotensis]GIF55150.1 hypothetical protein Air01nite_12450 [Asanoa iriomotensis]
MATTGLWRQSAWAFFAIEGALILAALISGAPMLTAIAAVAAVVVSVVVLIARRPPRAAAWWSLTVASGSVSLSRVTVAAGNRPVALDRGLAYGDIRALILYPALVIGLLVLGGTGALADTLDASVATLGIFVLLWLLLLHGSLVPEGTQLAVAALRPIGVSLVVGALVRLLFLVNPRAPTVRLVVASVICALLASVAVIGARAGYRIEGTQANTGLFATLFCVLLAAALVHPSSRTSLTRARTNSRRLRRGRVIMFVGLTLLGPLAWSLAVAIGRFDPGSPADFGPPVLAGAVISLLLLWRLALVARVADRRAEQLGVAVGELQGLQAELSYRAAHDPLTGLANRSVLSERLTALPRGGPHALLLIDLDGFKEINDSLGHPAGDELLVAVGRRLTRLAPVGSTLVRLGGDEFAVLLPETDEAAAMAFGAAVCGRLRLPYPSAHGSLAVSASVGVTAGALGARDPAEVLREADVALYSAKEAGKDRVAPYRSGRTPLRRRVRQRPR